MTIYKKFSLHMLLPLSVLAVSICLLLLPTGHALAASAGSCLVTTDSGGAALATPTSAACKTIFSGATKDGHGTAITASGCYAVTYHNATPYVSQPIACSDARFAATTCPAGYKGTPPNCAIQALCPSGETGTPPNCVLTSAVDPAAQGGNCADPSHCDLVSKYINPFINFLAALVGVAVVTSIIIGGIQYGSSAGDPQKVSAAKNRIRNAIIALITFIFLYALLNFLVPGGLV